MRKCLLILNWMLVLSGTCFGGWTVDNSYLSPSVFLFKPVSDSTTAFQLQDQAGNLIFIFDSTNQLISIKTTVTAEQTLQKWFADDGGLVADIYKDASDDGLFRVYRGDGTIQIQLNGESSSASFTLGNWGIGRSPTVNGLDVLGNVLFQPVSDSITALQFKDQAGNVDFNYDSTNGRIGVKTATPDATLQVVGGAKIGDDNTNYASFETDGELALTGTARATKHINVPLVGGSGLANPTVRVTEAPFLSWTFAVNDDEHHTFQAPHDMDYTADILIYVEWYTSVSQVDDEVNWQIEWNARAVGETVNAGATTDTSGDVNCPAQWVYAMTLVETIPGNSIVSDDVIGIDLTRIAIVDGTNPTAGSIHVLALHIEYTSNKLGE